jgi:hypothetical protein
MPALPSPRAHPAPPIASSLRPTSLRPTTARGRTASQGFTWPLTAATSRWCGCYSTARPTPTWRTRCNPPDPPRSQARGSCPPMPPTAPLCLWMPCCASLLLPPPSPIVSAPPGARHCNRLPIFNNLPAATWLQLFCIIAAKQSLQLPQRHRQSGRFNASTRLQGRRGLHDHRMPSPPPPP